MDLQVAEISIEHYRVFNGISARLGRGSAPEENLHRYVRGEGFLESTHPEYLKEQPDPRGGKTVVTVTTPDGRTVIATAYCSVRDRFEYRIGRAIALGRAKAHLKKYGGYNLVLATPSRKVGFVVGVSDG